MKVRWWLRGNGIWMAIPTATGLSIVLVHQQMW